MCDIAISWHWIRLCLGDELMTNHNLNQWGPSCPMCIYMNGLRLLVLCHVFLGTNLGLGAFFLKHCRWKPVCFSLKHTYNSVILSLVSFSDVDDIPSVMFILQHLPVFSWILRVFDIAMNNKCHMIFEDYFPRYRLHFVLLRGLCPILEIRPRKAIHLCNSF